MGYNLSGIFVITQGNIMKAKNFLRPLTMAACGFLAAAPAGADTIDIGTITNNSTITAQNTGSPEMSFGSAVGGFAINLVSGGDLNPVDHLGATTNRKNVSGTAKLWVPVSETGRRTVNSPVKFQSRSTENDMASNSSVTGKTGEGRADLTIEVTVVPESWTWVMIGLGFAGVGVLSLIKPRRKPPRYII